ncbi:MAG: DEAD/DEAH box helicase [Thermoplasmataceae archaeon]
MASLHGTWVAGSNGLKGRFTLWIELDQDDPGLKHIPPERMRKRRTFPYQPLSYDGSRLIEKVYQSALRLGNGNGGGFWPVSDRINAMLPTLDSGYPLKYREISKAVYPTQDESVTLRNWLLRVYQPYSSQVVTILLATARMRMKSMPSYWVANSSIWPENDIAFWAVILLEILRQVKSMNFLPSIRENTYFGSRIFSPQWIGAFEEKFDQIVEKFAPLIPPVALCIGENTTMEPAAIIREFIYEYTDAAIRLLASGTRPRYYQYNQYYGRPSEEWINELQQLNNYGNGTMRGKLSNIVAFRDSVLQWIDTIRHEVPLAPFKLCFRLDDPKDDLDMENLSENSRWDLVPLLQSSDDPTLLLEVEGLLSNNPEYQDIPGGNVQDFRKSVINEIRRAGSISPSVKKLLGSPENIEPIELTTDEAYNFLSFESQLLQENSYRVFIPGWWKNRKAKSSFQMRVSADTDGMFSMDQLVKFDWKASLSKGRTRVTLSEDQFMKVVRAKQPLVRTGKGWMEIDRNQIKHAMELIRTYRENNGIPFVQMLRMGLDEKRLREEAALELEYGDDHLRDALEKLKGHAAFEILPTPLGFSGQLRPYQVKGFSWLYFMRTVGLGCILADDMGLGKTIQAIGYILTVSRMEKKAGKTLVVCPMSVMTNWSREIERFAPSLKVLLHHGQLRKAGRDKFEEKIVDYDVIITSNDLVMRDADTLREIKWSVIILDEAQNFKNRSTKRAGAIRKLRSVHRIALTGTPVENRLSELWSIIDFLNPGYLGTQREFHTKWETPFANGDAKAKETLRNLVNPFILRREKSDKKVITDLPEKNEMNVYCGLTEEQASLYEAHVREMMSSIENSEGIARKGRILSMITRLKQICDHPVLYLADKSGLKGRSEKLERLKDMISELVEDKEKAVVFTQYVTMGRHISEFLEEELGAKVLFFHGGLNARERDMIINTFQNSNGEYPILVSSLKAGGLGLNLTEANNVFHYDRWWNPAVENQATDRTYRIGQKKNVQVYKFVTVGTLEENIDALLKGKTKLAGDILKNGEEWLTELSTDEIREIISLRH